MGLYTKKAHRHSVGLNLMPLIGMCAASAHATCVVSSLAEDSDCMKAYVRWCEKSPPFPGGFESCRSEPWRAHWLFDLHFQLRAVCLGPVDVVELAALFVGALVGVCTEVVALCLQKILRQT